MARRKKVALAGCTQIMTPPRAKAIASFCRRRGTSDGQERPLFRPFSINNEICTRVDDDTSTMARSKHNTTHTLDI